MSAVRNANGTPLADGHHAVIDAKVDGFGSMQLESSVVTKA